MPTATRQRKPRKRGATVEEVFARGLAAARGKMPQAELAQRMNELGRPLHQTAIAKIESGARAVSLADALALAAALSVDPSQLIAGGFTREKQIALTPKLELEPRRMRRWLRGRLPLPGGDERTYFDSTLTDDEWRAHREVRGLANLLFLVDDYESAAVEQNRAGMDETLTALEEELRVQRRNLEQRRHG